MPATFGDARSRFRNNDGAFDCTKLPLLELEDKKGNVSLYLAVAFRILWFSADHPMGDPIRIVTTVERDGHDEYVIAEIVDTRLPRYLTTDGGQIATIPGPDGTPRAAINPAHVLYSDRKYALPTRMGHPVEKALTGAIGRVLARAGYGTEGALELLEDDCDGDVVDSPIAHPSDRLFDEVILAAREAGLTDDELVTLKNAVVGPNATSRSMDADDYAKLLGAISERAAGQHDARDRQPPATEVQPATPGPTPRSEHVDDAVRDARDELLRTQNRLGLTDDQVVAAIREVIPDFVAGSLLAPLDYARITTKLIEQSKVTHIDERRRIA
jgi:hypothetical protein